MGRVAHPLLATFDVFDTVLTRAVGSPEAVFLLLGRRLARQGLIGCSPEAFAHARIAAEERAHRNSGARCSLEDIYDELLPSLGLDAPHRSALADAECEVEAAVLRPVPAAVALVAAARARNARVLFLSDTYFPAAFIRQQLTAHGLWQPGDVCYTSAQWGALKQTGELYAVVEREERQPPVSFCHTGNDPQADVDEARSVGWRVSPRPEANPNRYERLLDASRYKTGGLSSAVAGASRLARLDAAASDARTATIRDVSAGVVAPVLMGYVLWLLRRAQELGLRRLFFLARDGQILLAIARRLVPKLGLDLDLRYLYASRQAWNPAAIFQGKPEELAWIWDTTDTLTTEMVLRRCRVAPETIAPQLEAAGFPRAAWSRQLAPAERRSLAGVLATEAVRPRILDEAASQRDLVLRYFRQEGLLESVPYGMVDLGWYGSMQKALAAVLAEAGHPAPPGFYFALHQGDIVDETPLHREAYYFDERTRLGYIDRVPNLIALMEMFCAADHGTTVGFEERAGRIEPVLASPVNAPAVAWGLPALQQTVQAFAGHLLVDCDLVHPYADLREPLTAVLTEFSRRPSREEAEVWGGFPWEDGLGTETTRAAFAHPYAPGDLWKAIKVGSIRPHHRAAWIEGSLALSSTPLRSALHAAHRIGRRRRALRAALARRLRRS